MASKLGKWWGSVLDAANETASNRASVKETHRMDANKASFAHYRYLRLNTQKML